jgi:hypothetical protein
MDESPDGKYVAVVTCDRNTPPICKLTVYRYSEDGSLKPMPGFVIPGDPGRLGSVGFVECENKKGEVALCLAVYDASSRRILYFDAATGELIREGTQGSRTGSGVDATAVPVIPTTPLPPVREVLEGWGGTIECWDVQGNLIGDPIRVLVPAHTGSTSPVTDIACAPDGSFIVTVGGVGNGGKYACVVTGHYD